MVHIKVTVPTISTSTESGTYTRSFTGIDRDNMRFKIIECDAGCSCEYRTSHGKLRAIRSVIDDEEETNLSEKIRLILDSDISHVEPDNIDVSVHFVSKENDKYVAHMHINSCLPDKLFITIYEGGAFYSKSDYVNIYPVGLHISFPNNDYTPVMVYRNVGNNYCFDKEVNNEEEL